MKRFIYALNSQERKELISLGFEEIAECYLNGNRAYVFENTPSKYATFSKENQGKYLVTNVAYFV